MDADISQCHSPGNDWSRGSQNSQPPRRKYARQEIISFQGEKKIYPKAASDILAHC